MTNSQAIAILIPLRDAAIRRRDDRAERFTAVEFEHMTAQMQEYYRNRHDDAANQADAFTLAIAAIQNDRSAL